MGRIALTAMLLLSITAQRQATQYSSMTIPPNGRSKPPHGLLCLRGGFGPDHETLGAQQPQQEENATVYDLAHDFSLFLSRFDAMHQVVTRAKEEIPPDVFSKITSPDSSQGTNQRRCVERGCSKASLYGGLQSGVPVHCRLHMKDGEIDALNRKCSWSEGCEKSATFGELTSGGARGPAIFCALHRLPTHINVKVARCSQAGCSNVMTHLPPLSGSGQKGGAAHGGKRQLGACKTHAGKGWHVVGGKTCEEHGCERAPSYGYRKGSGAPGEGKRVRCGLHKLDGHEDLKFSRVCAAPDCKRRPWWSAGPERDEATHCRDHRLPGAVHLHPFPLCSEPGCSTRGVYGTEAEPSRRYCPKHKKPWLYDVVRELCVFPLCTRQPSFVADRKSRKREFCYEHAPATYYQYSSRKQRGSELGGVEGVGESSEGEAEGGVGTSVGLVVKRMGRSAGLKGTSVGTSAGLVAPKLSSGRLGLRGPARKVKPRKVKPR